MIVNTSFKPLGKIEDRWHYLRILLRDKVYYLTDTNVIAQVVLYHPTRNRAIKILSVSKSILHIRHQKKIYKMNMTDHSVRFHFALSPTLLKLFQLITVFVRIHAHARIHTHCWQNRCRTWNFLWNICILQPFNGTKCGNNIEISKFCMRDSSHVPLVYQWVRGGMD